MGPKRATTAVMVSQLWRWFADARRFEESTQDALAAQEAKLLSIVRANRDTVYGRQHGFASIESIEDFQQQVPINSYEHLAPYIERAADGEPNMLTAEAPLVWHHRCHVTALALLGAAIVADAGALVAIAALIGLAGALAYGVFFAIAVARMARAAVDGGRPKA